MNDSAAIQAICLDLDDTLWPIAPVIRRAELRTRQWLEDHYPAVATRLGLQDMQQRLAGFMENFPQLRHDMTHVRRNLLSALAEEAGHPPRVGEEAFEVFYEERNRVGLYLDVLPPLNWMSERFPLVAVTNGNADLDKVGPSGFFVASVQAREVGSPKPDRRIFEVAAGAVGVSPARILHAGDDPRTDIQGGRNACMQTAWVNRREEAWPDEVKLPGLVVRDLLELVQRLAGGRKERT
jgi:FMN phosphatase YigB (HAD superfamily)